MLVLCSGMPRSASTWSYRVAHAALKRRGRLREDQCRYIHEPTSIDAQLDELLHSARDADVVIKCHLLGPRTLRSIQEGEIHNIFTHRDPRDATASVLRVGDIVDEAARFVDLLKSQLPIYLSHASGPSLCISYSEVVDDRAIGLRRLVEFLEVSLDDEELAALSDRLGMARTRARAAGLTEDDLAEDFAHEPGTLLHINHVTDGGTGTWRRELSDAQARAIAQDLAPFFDTFGYAV